MKMRIPIRVEILNQPDVFVRYVRLAAGADISMVDMGVPLAPLMSVEDRLNELQFNFRQFIQLTKRK